MSTARSHHAPSSRGNGYGPAEALTTVLVLCTFGTLISTFVIGALFRAVAHWLGYALGFLYALISPTDPIAVVGIIGRVGAPKELETRITGESLFNDGVGAVIFLTILDIATGASTPDVASVSWFFVQETVGGIALGWLLGWTVYRTHQAYRSPTSPQTPLRLPLADELTENW